MIITFFLPLPDAAPASAAAGALVLAFIVSKIPSSSASRSKNPKKTFVRAKHQARSQFLNYVIIGKACESTCSE
jgi:hypothetical protein